MTRGREKFHKYKNIINLLVKCVSILPKKFQLKLLTFFRNTKGKIGIGIRYCLIKNIAKNCGENVSIHPGVYLLNPQNLSIGNNVSIHPMCYFECGPEGKISIGNNVSIAHAVTILAVSHNYNNLEMPIRDQGITQRKVIIEDDVWIGAKATILYGRKIERGSIVGANTLVAHDVKKNNITGGVPNHTIKVRNNE